MALVRPAIAALKSGGARVILFIDPDPAVLDRIPESGADGVEIYTGRIRRRISRRQHMTLCSTPARGRRAPRRIEGWSSTPATTSICTTCRR